MSALTNALPLKSSRTSTNAMARPAMELMMATINAMTSVSSSAATASGWVMAAQKVLQPPLNALVISAATGRSTSSDRYVTASAGPAALAPNAPAWARAEEGATRE